eukprot:284955_1
MSARQNTDIIKEAWLYKKSKHIGRWRKRWTVLTADELFTLKHKRKDINASPTEKIQLSNINSIDSSCNIIEVTTANQVYEFKANKESDTQEWIDSINKYRYNCIKIPLTVECKRDSDYNDNFQLLVPYDNRYEYSIQTLIVDILNYCQKKHDPSIKFIATRIKSDSFIGQELVYADYDWNSCADITQYEKIVVEQIGIQLEIDIDLFEHKINKMICREMQNMNELCSIYAQVRYQHICTEQYLNHL